MKKHKHKKYQKNHEIIQYKNVFKHFFNQILVCEMEATGLIFKQMGEGIVIING